MGELENGRMGWKNVGSGYSGPTDDIATPEQTKAQAAAENLKHVAKDQAESAKTQIRSIAETGKDRMADQLEHVAKALRSTGEGLRGEQETAPISQYVDVVGDKVEQASRFLREHQAIDLVDGIESAARRQPWLFLGGAFAVGLAIGRFFKSTVSMDVGGGSFESGGGSFDTGTGEGVIGGGTSGYGTSGYGTSGYGTSGYGTSGGAGDYATSAMSALGVSSAGVSRSSMSNAGSSDLGPNDLGSSSYGAGIANANIQSGYPMGEDVQAGYPEPEQSITTSHDTRAGELIAPEGAAPTTPTRIDHRLPGDDDESR